KPCPCCTEAHNEFDFWLGEWTVYNTQEQVVGTNKISKVKAYSNCVIREEWTSKGSNKGTSYNYYNLGDNTWNQVWIDNSGFSLTLKGNRIGNQMILKSDLLDGKNGKYYNQITWQLNEDETVTQTWIIFNKEEKLIQQAFKGIYKKTVK
ncbi:MAG: hypothetical protein HKN90_08440, partial [Flavobacteriaceae bacterium]|nr:hypothetical protein [Flavobacteriaceae bacterium]